jgi:hypothetical protein
MSNKEYLNKITLLKLMQSEFYIKKNTIKYEEKLILEKKIIICKDLYDKNELIFENLKKAALEFHDKTLIDLRTDQEILSSVSSCFNSKSNLSVLIICSNETYESVKKRHYFNKNICINNEKNNLLVFNALSLSDKITNTLKKQIWENYKYIISYE